MDEQIVPTPGEKFTDDQAMALAIQVAMNGASFVSPNPLVGCVILDRDHKFLASGFHALYGGSHAEVNAYQKLSAEQLKQSQFFVTLEPCAHQGKTPSCAKALAQMNLKRVVYGLKDPFPLVSGKGAQILKDAGVDVQEYQGDLKSKLEEVAEVFLKNTREKKVFVAMKVAMSLDGQIALKTGESKWITSEKSREYTHELRSRYDAILVGRRTVEADDPLLNIRHPRIQKKNKVVILDPQGLLLQQIEEGREFKFLTAHDPQDIFFATMKYQSEKYRTAKFTDLPQLMEQLWSIGLRSIFVEGGARTYSEFLKSGLIDRLHLFVAPSIIGAGNGLSWTQNYSVSELTEKLQMQINETRLIGPDIYLTACRL